MTAGDSESARIAHDPVRDIVTFDQPPVSEVVAGVGFTNPDRLNVAEIGRYWAKAAEQYPTSELGVPLPPPGSQFPLSLMNSPRLLLRSQDGTKLIQAQENWFLFNWIRVKGEQYPRYHEVFGAFQGELAKFQDFLAERGIGNITSFMQFRLTYVNHIPRSHGWSSLDQVRDFLPDFFSAWANHRFLRAPSGFAVQFSNEVAPGRLDVSLRNGRTRDDPEETFVLEIGVSSPVSPKDPATMQAWFDQAREAIVRSFVDLTSQSAHRIWGLHE
jgi:uncharacterized protein (TIGR04255 family)